ncbi:unnamed protein product [Protopolystoma xenopodis]|uniref:Uncharacterized protein n=1 Tax=Protopolystoma xenopodis TaxID=117903 RepID=A0A3S5CV47_9PLAT|nr:unnamed protein product [Protopolystoma xenopodis]
MNLPRQHESSSKANRQLVKRNPSLVVFWWNRHSNLFTQHFHSNSVAGRLLVEPTFESLHPTLPLEMEGRRLLVALTIESLHPTLSLEIEVSYRRLLVEPTFESLHPTLSLEVEVSSSRLLVEPTVESLHSTLSLEMERHRECSSKANRQLVKRNSPSSSGGTDKSSSKANRQLVKRNSPSSSGGTDLRISSPNTSTRNGSNPNNVDLLSLQ